MIMRRNILFAFLCFIIASCTPDEDDFHHYHITFCNNSDKAVYIVESSELYLWNVENLLRDSDTRRIAPHTMNRDELGNITSGCAGITFEEYLWDTNLIIYVIDADMLESMSNLEANYKDAILQKCELSRADLTSLNWTIEYPFTPLVNKGFYDRTRVP